MKKMFNTWKEAMFNPLEFYQKLPKKTRYREPSLFYLKINAITLGIIYVFLLLLGAFFVLFLGALGGPALGPVAMLGGGAGLLIVVGIAIVLFPIILLLEWGLLFVGAGITHLFVLLFGGKQGYVETFKAQAYAVAPAIFSIIPYVGYAATVYTIVLQVIGIHQRQKLSWGKSVTIILLPMAIATILVLLLLYALFTAGWWMGFRGGSI